MGGKRSCGWGLGLAFAAMGGTAAAEPPRHERTAVIAIDLGAEVPSYLREKAADSIEHGLVAAGYDVIPLRQVTVPAGLAHCRAGSCLHDLALQLHVDSVVVAKIERHDENTQVDIAMFDGTTIESIAEVREVCDLCGASELEERVNYAASMIRQRVEETRARTTARREVTTAVVAPRPVMKVVPGHTPVGGLALGLAGAAAVGAGIYLLAIDGDGTCHPGDGPVYPAPGATIRYPDPDDPDVFLCRKQYATRTGGVVGLGVGVAAMAAASVWVIGARREHSLLVTPTATGAIVGVSGHW